MKTMKSIHAITIRGVMSKEDSELIQRMIMTKKSNHAIADNDVLSKEVQMMLM